MPHARSSPQNRPPSEDFRRNWARIIQKVFEVDALVCSHCQGRLRPVSFIERKDPPVIRRILEHLGLWLAIYPLIPHFS